LLVLVLPDLPSLAHLQKTRRFADQVEASHIVPWHVQPAASYDIKEVSWCSLRLQLPDCYLRSSPEHASPCQEPSSDIHLTKATPDRSIQHAAFSGSLHFSSITDHLQSERKIRHIEGLLEQQRRIAAELEQVDDQTRREVEEGLRHEHSISHMIAQSEPTTPPEYHDAFPSMSANTLRTSQWSLSNLSLSAATSRPNRYSTTSLTSQTGVGNRSNRSSIQLTSPSAGVIRPYTAAAASNIPSQSVPGSRRQSDDEEEEDDFLFGGYDSTFHRAAAK
jgi:hypothetical protein